MSARARLSMFALVLAGAFAVAYGVGAAVPDHRPAPAPATTDPAHVHDGGAGS